MSYTVLARKWRPKNFEQLVGQAHVMQALANALDQNRLHHAYLFTGTRGVGKTTIARIFAKALNCEQGITSKPCGVCASCRAIDEGTFIDLIEVDAASKTKVDDTREILDNVQYAATQGRFKVYLIDEVHMLSKSSFNALLKTLEEPPEHVKFILATTDPHKLPITVLSRCLQFNLMRLTETQIQNHLAFVLEQESIPFEMPALALIAKSADGSARDALSLLDQAIAYGGGNIGFTPIQTMLGLVDQQFTFRVLQALASNGSVELKNLIAEISAMGIDYPALLTQMIEALHALSYQQVFKELPLNSGLPETLLHELAEAFSPERVQMLYQIALLTKQDMQLAQDIRIGFEMGLMRMLAFLPADSVSTESVQPLSSSQPVMPPAMVANTSSPTNEASNIDSGLSSGLKPNEAAMIQDMPYSEAATHLNSARSLIGQKAKKKPLIQAEPVSAAIAVAAVPIVPAVVEQPTAMPTTSFDHYQALSEHLQFLEDLDDEISESSIAEEASASDAHQPVGVSVQMFEQSDAAVNDYVERQTQHRSDEFEESTVPASHLSASPFSHETPQPVFQEPVHEPLQHQAVQQESLPEPQTSNIQVIPEPPARDFLAQNVSANGVANSLDEFEHQPSDFYDVPWGDEPVLPAGENLANINNDSVEVAAANLPSASQGLDELQETWRGWLAQLSFEGMQREVAWHSILLPAGNGYALALHPQQDFGHLQVVKNEVLEVLRQFTQVPLDWQIWPENSVLTPTEFYQQQADHQLEAAKLSLLEDSNVQNLVQALDMQILEQTIQVV